MAVTFADPPPLPEWLAPQLPFARRVADIDGVRMHFVDHGEGRPVFMQHGNPMWCYLWRKVATALGGHPLRLIIPDMPGLGLSDKPRALSWHNLGRHADLLAALVEALDLQDVIIVGQDWGGPWSTGMAARVPERVTGAVFGNTQVVFPRGKMRSTAFHRFANRPIVSDFAFRVLGFPLPVLHKVQGDTASIGANEKRAYRYPLRHFADRAAPLALARMVPYREGHPTLPELERCDRWARDFSGPTELVWGLRDPILGKSLKRMREVFAEARVTETQAGHFLQEEVPDELASAILRIAGLA